MANFEQAIEWLKKGKKVRRNSWNPHRYRYFDRSFDLTDADNPHKTHIIMKNQKGKRKNLSPDFFLFNDWEIFEEPETLSGEVENAYEGFEGTIEVKCIKKWIKSILDEIHNAMDLPNTTFKESKTLSWCWELILKKTGEFK